MYQKVKKLPIVEGGTLPPRLPPFPSNFLLKFRLCKGDKTVTDNFLVTCLQSNLFHFISY